MITMTRKQALAVAEVMESQAPKAGAITIEAIKSEILSTAVAIRFTYPGTTPDKTWLVGAQGTMQVM